MALSLVSTELKDRGSELLAKAGEVFERAREKGFDITIDLSALKQQLDEPFSIFVCGEFNSGKSSLLNKLAGAPIAPVGILPTTSALSALAVPDLPSLQFVDSPGTNSIHKDHQEITRAYLERSDIVLFVTSVERPLSESEAQFLGRIHQIWQRSIIVAINKIDLLKDESAKTQIEQYVENGLKELFGFSPPIHCVSAETGAGLKDLEEALRSRLTEAEQLRLKNVGVQETVRVHLKDVSEQLERRLSNLLLEKRVLDKNLKRAISRFEETDLFFSLFKEKISHLFQSGSIEFGILLEEHFGVISALKTRILGRQDEVKQKVHSLIENIHLEEKLEEIVHHAVKTFSDFQQRVMTELNQDLELAEALSVQELSLPKISFVPVDNNKLARSFLIGTEQGLNKFFMYSSLAAATGIGVSIAQTAALVDISGLLTVVILTTIGFRALPREKKRIQKEVGLQFERVAESCYESLEAGLKHHLKVCESDVDAHFEPLIGRCQNDIEECESLKTAIDSHERSIESFLKNLAN